jgi:hypothetical protein
LHHLKTINNNELKSEKKPHLKVPKIIILVGKFLQFFSIKLTTLYLARLFTTPIKYKVPKRELEMDKKSSKIKLYM